MLVPRSPTGVPGLQWCGRGWTCPSEGRTPLHVGALELSAEPLSVRGELGAGEAARASAGATGDTSEGEGLGEGKQRPSVNPQFCWGLGLLDVIRILHCFPIVHMPVSLSFFLSVFLLYISVDLSLFSSLCLSVSGCLSVCLSLSGCPTGIHALTSILG